LAKHWADSEEIITFAEFKTTNGYFFFIYDNMNKLLHLSLVKINKVSKILLVAVGALIVTERASAQDMGPLTW